MAVVVVVEAEVEATAPSGLNLAGWPASSHVRCLAAATAQSDPPQQAAGLGAVFNPVQGAIQGEVLGAFLPTLTFVYSVSMLLEAATSCSCTTTRSWRSEELAQSRRS